LAAFSIAAVPGRTQENLCGALSRKGFLAYADAAGTLQNHRHFAEYFAAKVVRHGVEGFPPIPPWTPL
jgi:hypothetical protein